MQHPNWRSFCSAPVFSGAFPFDHLLTHSPAHICHLPSAICYSPLALGYAHRPKQTPPRSLSRQTGEGRGERSLSTPPRFTAGQRSPNEECNIRTGEAFAVRLSFLALFLSITSSLTHRHTFAICHLPFAIRHWLSAMPTARNKRRPAPSPVRRERAGVSVPFPPRPGSLPDNDRRMRNATSELAKLLQCACLFWRFSFRSPPHSLTGTHLPFAICHLLFAIGSRLCPPPETNAAPLPLPSDGRGPG